MRQRRSGRRLISGFASSAFATAAEPCLSVTRPTVSACSRAVPPQRSSRASATTSGRSWPQSSSGSSIRRYEMYCVLARTRSTSAAYRSTCKPRPTTCKSRSPIFRTKSPIFGDRRRGRRRRPRRRAQRRSRHHRRVAPHRQAAPGPGRRPFLEPCGGRPSFGSTIIRRTTPTRSRPCRIEVQQWTARSTAEALNRLDGREYRAVITDIGRTEGGSYNGDAGLELVKAIRVEQPQQRIFVFTTETLRRSRGYELLRAGASGVWASSTDLLAALGAFS